MPVVAVTARVIPSIFDRLGYRGEEVPDYAKSLFGPDDVRHDEGELVATEPGDSRSAAARADEAFGDLAQQPVARVVAQGVVDLLEAVEVQESNRRPARVGKGACRPIEEQGPVGEPGQEVVRRLVPLAVGFESQLFDEVGLVPWSCWRGLPMPRTA